MTTKTQRDRVKLAVMATNIEHIKSELGEIKDTLKNLSSNYVTKAEFEPVRKLVYGVVGLILVAVVGTVLAIALTQ